MSARLVLLRAMGGNLFHRSIPDFSGFLAIFGMSWLIEASLQSLLFFFKFLFPFVLCLNFPFYKDISHIALEAHSLQDAAIFSF